MVKVNLEALRAQADSSKKASQEAKEALEEYQKAVSQFQSDDQLKGKAYQSAKNYSGEPLTSLLKGANAFYEEASLVLEKLVNQYESKVDSKSWDSEELERLIHQANQIISRQEQMVDRLKRHKKRNLSIGIQSHQMVIEVFQEMKHRFELILQHLEEFSYESASWFSRLQGIRASLSSAISDLSGSLHVSSGDISVPKNRDWEHSLLEFDKQVSELQLIHKIESLSKKDQLIIKDLKKTYHLDTQSAYALYKLQQGILEKAKKEGWDNKKIIFEYNRLLASCSYGVIPLKGAGSKNFGDFKLTNNSTYVASRWQALCQTEDWETTKKLLRKYGLSLSEINHLRKAVSVQHEFANEERYGNSCNKLDLSHEAVQLACFTEQPSKNIKRVILHKGSHYMNLGLEHSEISYKGDIDSGRFDSPDILSDIDAVNMYKKMTKTSPQLVFNVPVNYHRDIRFKTINRLDEFYKNNSLGTNNKTIGKWHVNIKVHMPTPGSVWIRGTETTNKKARLDNKEYYKENMQKFWKIMDHEQGGEK